MIDENRFRHLCRKDQGGIEGQRFQVALDDSQADPVEVNFDLGFEELKAILLPRTECEQYAKIAKEERGPEERLLGHLKPEAHEFVKHNRSKMVSMLKEIMVQYPHTKSQVIVWPLWTPDTVPMDILEAYVRKYD